MGGEKSRPLLRLVLATLLLSSLACGDPGASPPPRDGPATADARDPSDADASTVTVDAPVDALPVADVPADAAPADSPIASPSSRCTSCPPGMKWCKGRCVSPTDPVLGCGSTCFPCSARNTLQKCDANGYCLCEPGYADCNDSLSDGCETDLSTSSNCGACGKRCSNLCTPAGCADACPAPLTRCVQSCVDLTTSTAHCGRCDSACPKPWGGSVTCNAGTCGEPSCPPRFTLCRTPGSDFLTCADLQNDPVNCGACFNRCITLMSAIQACVAGKCGTASSEVGVESVATKWSGANCGQVGRTCAADEYCGDGQCRPRSDWVLVRGLQLPEDLAVDAGEVFFSTLGDNGIYKLKPGAGPPVPLATGQAKPTRIAVDATHVYWTNNLGASIMRVRRDASGSPELVTRADQPTSIVLDASSLYWINRATCEVRRAPKGAGVESTVLGFSRAYCPSDLTLHRNVLYAAGQQLEWMELPDGPVRTVAATMVSAVAVDDDYEYYSQLSGFFSWKSRRGLRMSGQGRGLPATQLIAGECGVFVVSGTVGAVPQHPGMSYENQSDYPYPVRIAPGKRIFVHDGHLYWTDPSPSPTDGRILRARIGRGL
jgi:hypothetical protein